MRHFVDTELAPRPVGCYSQAISTDHQLYLAGQIGLDPATGELVDASFEAQLKQVFMNLASVLQASGADLNSVVKLTVYLSHFAEDYPKLDGIMADYFAAPFPARTTIGVAALPRNALVEIDAIAVL